MVGYSDHCMITVSLTVCYVLILQNCTVQCDEHNINFDDIAHSGTECILDIAHP